MSVEPKNDYSGCFRGTTLQLSDYLISPILTNGKDGDGLQLEKVGQFFSSSNSELTEVLAQKLPYIDLSVKIYRKSSSRVQRSILPTCKGNKVFVGF